MTRSVDYQVIVVGAGPAGSATAYHLARAGVQTLLMDKSPFPRDKVCGDCLSPRAQHYLARMGLLERVAAEAHRAERIRFRAPGGAAAQTRIAGDGALPDCTLVLPRERFDHLVQQHAVAAGADFRVGHVRGLLPAGGAELKGEQLPARLVVIATGAALGLIKRTPLAPQGPVHTVAARCYLDGLPEPGPGPDLRFFFDHLPLPGYAWLFPTGPASANLGYWYNGRDGIAAAGLLPRLLSEHPELRDLTAGAAPKQIIKGRSHGAEAHVGRGLGSGSGMGATVASASVPNTATFSAAVKGYPIRSDFLRAPLVADGLLAVGEAAGLVNPFTGEGIDYALESAELAAETIIRAFERDPDQTPMPAELLRDYRRALNQRFRPLFLLMQFGQRYGCNPWVFDRLFGRGERGQALVDTLIQVCFGAAPPARLLQPLALARLLLSRPMSDSGSRGHRSDSRV